MVNPPIQIPTSITRPDIANQNADGGNGKGGGPPTDDDGNEVETNPLMDHLRANGNVGDDEEIVEMTVVIDQVSATVTDVKTQEK